MSDKEEKFNRIIAQDSDRIKRICGYYNANAHDRKDMYQEVLVNIWNSLDNFRGDASINTWIYRIAVNTALRYTGNAYKHMKLIVNADTQNLSTVIDEESFEDKLLMEKHLSNLQNELNLLSVIDKALISLMLEGLSMKEIADIIGITESNVRVKIHRIKTHLKTKLRGQRYDTE